MVCIWKLTFSCSDVSSSTWNLVVTDFKFSFVSHSSISICSSLASRVLKFKTHNYGVLIVSWTPSSLLQAGLIHKLHKSVRQFNYLRFPFCQCSSYLFQLLFQCVYTFTIIITRREFELHNLRKEQNIILVALIGVEIRTQPIKSLRASSSFLWMVTTWTLVMYECTLYVIGSILTTWMVIDLGELLLAPRVTLSFPVSHECLEQLSSQLSVLYS